MVTEGKARLFKNKQGRYQIYLPVNLAQDSMFPFKVKDSTYVKVSFKNGNGKLEIADWIEPEESDSPTEN